MKRVLGVLVIFFVFRTSSGVCLPSSAAMVEEPVAIVCVLSGKAFAKADNKRTELEIFQRLRPGTFVETDTASKVVLAFFTGDRYEFGEKTSGTVERTGVAGTKGAIRQLTPIPVMIDIAPIAKEEYPGTRLAGTRIRTGEAAGQWLVNLYPSGGAAALAETAVVRFDPVAGHQQYRVELEDERGNTIFAVDTASTTVQIARDVLRPGANYYWRVRTLDAAKPAMRGEAVFSTLSASNAKRRAALQRHVEETGDRSLLGLLAELDRVLGLQREACEELKAALEHSPGNQPLAEAQARFGCSSAERPAKQKQ
jgi:hypothetical protein